MAVFDEYGINMALLLGVERTPLFCRARLAWYDYSLMR